MKIIDLHDPKRVSQKPDSVKVLFESADFKQDGFSIKKIELRHYLERIDENLGTYSLITSYVETDKGSVEMIYDEGFRGDNSLDKTVEFLVSNLGISGLILRSIITLNEQLKENT
jgi:hypothetical protein